MSLLFAKEEEAHFNQYRTQSFISLTFGYRQLFGVFYRDNVSSAVYTSC
ncbi:MAG: hypothetical protein JWQ09_416 [Segetibacter sp.]|nr:hypothetical protein [Segetibacter sp.]